VLQFVPNPRHTRRVDPETAQGTGAIACPRCASTEVERLSEYGSTPCKSLYRCIACREPFDYFKPY
jgi:ring-1,2-phenylacetyl-CoA epoxidase subunit PaaD